MNEVNTQPLSSKRIATQFLIFFAAVIAILFYPFQLFFSGKWEAKPYVNITSIHNLVSFTGDKASSIEETLIQNDITSVGFRYYSLTLFIGVLIGFYLMIKFFAKNSISEAKTERLFIGLVIIGLIGARLGFVLMNLDHYTDNHLPEIINFKAGGLTLYGGLLTGGLYLMFYCWKNKIEFRTTLDALIPATLMVIIWARFGNFFNYEAYGQPTSVAWKMYVPQGAVTNNRYNIGGKLESFYHPTFLYEIILNILLFLVLTYFYDFLTSKRKGNVAGFMMIGYGVGRYFLENFRLDATPLNPNLTYGQLFSVILATIGAILIITSKREPKRLD
jgi:phosphatidylglycerol---prolipoprotein diacylglyceryl transferase